MAVPRQLKIEFRYEPAVPLLGIYPKELKTGIQREIDFPIHVPNIIHDSQKVCAHQEMNR